MPTFSFPPPTPSRKLHFRRYLLSHPYLQRGRFICCLVTPFLLLSLAFIALITCHFFAPSKIIDKLDKVSTKIPRKIAKELYRKKRRKLTQTSKVLCSAPLSVSVMVMLEYITYYYYKNFHCISVNFSVSAIFPFSKLNTKALFCTFYCLKTK